MKSAMLAMTLNPSKSCLLDPRQTFLLKDCLDILLPSITKLINIFLSEGFFADTFTKVVVTPLIKKALFHSKELKNYCLVCGLSFLSKFVEQVVAMQLTSHINRNKRNNPHHSAYKECYSTETALLPLK